MKILLVCAAGMSTGILVKKMKAYWEEQGEELEIKAVGIGECQNVSDDFDILMVGPQVSYRLNEIKEVTNLPCAVIESYDYAVGNCSNIMKMAKKLYDENK